MGNDLLTDSPSTVESSQRAASAPAPARRSRNWIAIALWSVLFAVVLMVLGIKLLMPPHHDLSVLYHAPAFALTDQNGQAFGASDLHARAYICDFIFTTCGSACPLMTQKLADVQGHTPPEVHLVSFTVDPAHDTPAVLKEYAQSHGADPARWHFLTGAPEVMTQVIRDMKIGVQAGDGNNPILHSQKFLLVDGDGNIRGIYESGDPAAMQTMLADATWVSTTRYARGY